MSQSKKIPLLETKCCQLVLFYLQNQKVGEPHTVNNTIFFKIGHIYCAKVINCVSCSYCWWRISGEGIHTYYIRQMVN